MLVKTYAAAVHGINAIVVTAETVVSKGVQYCIVGLPDTAVKESHELCARRCCRADSGPACGSGNQYGSRRCQEGGGFL